jgi:hypothetical protein
MLARQLQPLRSESLMVADRHVCPASNRSGADATDCRGHRVGEPIAW